MLLLESGSRINTTDFEWPKNIMPSGFSMKVIKIKFIHISVYKLNVFIVINFKVLCCSFSWETIVIL